MFTELNAKLDLARQIAFTLYLNEEDLDKSKEIYRLYELVMRSQVDLEIAMEGGEIE